MAPVATTPDTSIPAAPSYLPQDVQQRWTKAYTAALAQAKRDYPNSATQQRSVAMKAANAILAVPAPTSADDIDRLQEWQVLPGTRKTVTQKVNGKPVEMRICVTTDGQKYAFPATSVVPGKEGTNTTGRSADGGKVTDPRLEGAAV